MAISKAKKAEKVQLLAKELETSTTAIIGTFSKLTVAKDFDLFITPEQSSTVTMPSGTEVLRTHISID